MGTSAREVPNKDTNQTHEPEGHISSREHISYTPCRPIYLIRGTLY
jgi:hypothetical protein